MNWHDGDSPGPDAADDLQAEHLPMADDAGTLPYDCRRALVQLLSGPFLDARRHPRLWPVLVRDEAVIRSRLADLFLELVMDPDQRVAFTRQMSLPDVDVPILLRRAPLTLVDSVLLLFLRLRLSQADTLGERAVVSVAEMHEHLSLYERTSNTDRSGFAKRVTAAIEKVKKHGLLQKIRASDDRYEISPTLKLLFSADEILVLTKRYAAIATGDLTTADEQNDGRDDDPDEAE
jgi:hypothetical protein